MTRPGTEARTGMRAGIVLPFALATAIWGSTWLAITFQFGVVAPEVSVAYRFALASTLIALACIATGRTLRFAPATHAWLAAQGATVYGINYVFVYQAERHIASGLVAMLFSTIVFLGPAAARLVFGTPFTARMLAGATLGVAGIALLFFPAFAGNAGAGSLATGVALALAAPATAAIGNLVSMRLQRDQVPLLPGMAWGMGYGALAAALVATLSGVPWSFDARPAYLASLAYLAVFGSVVAFAAYFRVLERAGPGPASFVGVSTPVIAMVLTTLVEGYRWNAAAVLGLMLAIAGNVFALRTAK